ncbi:acid resistance repetitive basic protein Asr [Serratia odorifera]|nr:acid resistance repetitive basic protein Asr [Serratia odorifera]
MKKVFALVVAAAMGLSSVAFAADAATTAHSAPVKSSHVTKHHAKKTTEQKAQAAKKQVKASAKKAPAQKAQAAKKQHKKPAIRKRPAHRQPDCGLTSATLCHTRFSGCFLSGVLIDAASLFIRNHPDRPDCLRADRHDFLSVIFLA